MRRTVELLAAVTVLAGCEALLVEPAPAPEARFAFEATQETTAAYGDLRPIMERVGSAEFQLIRSGEVRDTTVAARYDDGGLTARLVLRPEEAVGWLEVHVTLRQAVEGFPLFRGHGLVQTYRAAPVAEIEIEPLAYIVNVTPSSHTFRSLGDTLQLTADVEFVTGDPIEGAPIDWSSSNPEIMEVLADGRAVPRRSGAASVLASSLGAFDGSVLRVSQSVARFTGFGPADTTVTLGEAFQLRPYGEDPDGFPLLPGADVAWTAGGSVDVEPTTGTVTTVTTGAGYVEVTIGGVLHHVDVTVTP